MQRINPDLGGVTVQNLKESIVGNTRLALLVLTGTVALVAGGLHKFPRLQDVSIDLGVLSITFSWQFLLD